MDSEFASHTNGINFQKLIYDDWPQHWLICTSTKLTFHTSEDIIGYYKLVISHDDIRALPWLNFNFSYIITTKNIFYI